MSVSNRRARDGAGDSDKDDRRLFASLGPDLVEDILRVKHGGEESPDILSLGGYDGDFDEAATRRIGDIIGQSTQLKWLHLGGPLNVASLCEGLQHNKHIEKLGVGALVGLSDTVEMENLAPFLTNNPKLSEIKVTRCRIGQVGIYVLSNALSSRTEDTLEKLDLTRNLVGDVVLNQLVRTLRRSRNLIHLQLSYCHIGKEGCTLLATLLERQDCALRSLHVDDNPIDDECAVIFADSLSKNTKLERLVLHGITALTENVRITKRGWKAFLNLVHKRTSIGSVMSSNHALESFGEGTRYPNWAQRNITQALGAHDGSLLLGSLKLNQERDKGLVLRCKILWGHATGAIQVGDSLSAVLGNSPEVVIAKIPPLLSCFGNAPNETIVRLLRNYGPTLAEPRVATTKLECVYSIIRSGPDLCFPEEPRARAD